ncbi:MAG: response regulator, partial [Pseudomonadota bacterium]
MSSSHASKILLVEDDAAIATVIEAALEDEGFATTRVASLAARDAALAKEPFSVMLTDVILEDGDGLATLANVRREAPIMPIIVLSAQNTLDTAVRASDSDAFEYFPKPFDLDELVQAVCQAVGIGETAEDAMPDASAEGLPLVGRSAAMQSVYRMITRVLRNDLASDQHGEI